MQVSAIIPTYNRAPLLKQAIESLLAQTYSNWECIVVDDGSTDETESVVNQYGPQVQYVHQSNSGPAVARNRGIEKAEGESLLFLDSDDLLLPNALEMLVRELDQHPKAGVSYGGFYGFLPDGRPGKIPEVPHLPDGEYASPWPNRQDVKPHGLSVNGQVLPSLLKHDVILMGATLVRRSIVEESEGFDPTIDLMEHWDFFLRLAERGVPFVSVDKPVLRLRMHDENLSSDFEGMLRHRLEMIDKYLPTDHPDRESLREEARANAFAFLGVCMCSTGQLERGLQHLRSTLNHRPLSLETYDALTQKLCQEALAAPNPEQKLQSLLNLLGPSSRARSIRHFVLSRFYRVLATRKAQSVQKTDLRTWKSGASAGWQAGLSGLHLGGAVAYRPELGRTYAQRMLRKIQ